MGMLDGLTNMFKMHDDDDFDDDYEDYDDDFDEDYDTSSSATESFLDEPVKSLFLAEGLSSS